MFHISPQPQHYSIERILKLLNHPILSVSCYFFFQNSSYACEYAAEIQLNLEAKHAYGLKLTPAKWEAFSDFGNRTTLANPKHCKADSVVTNAESRLLRHSASNNNLV